MKYKVGDKVRVRRDLQICTYYEAYMFVSGMNDYKGSVVTISKVCATYYCIEEDERCWIWTDEMFDGLADEELTAEEAIKIQAEICSSTMCKDCEIDKFRYDSHCECSKFRSKHPEKVIEALKQWKKDHEKKQIETECMWYVQIIEADTHILKHEEPLKGVPEDRTIAEVLKKWCSEHEGKYYAISERRCVVKE